MTTVLLSRGPGANQATPSAEQRESQAVARKILIRAAIEKAAFLARRKEIPQLKKVATSDANPYRRVIFGYALWRIDSSQFTATFLEAFRSTNQTPLWLTELEVFSHEHPAPKFPGDSKPFSYWSVSNALLSIAGKGNGRALETWLEFAGGDGEFGEGRSEDFTTFFLENPAVALQHWAIVRKHKNELWYWGHSPAAIKHARSRYSKLLPKNDSRRDEVMSMLDHLLSLSIEESKVAGEPK